MFVERLGKEEAERYDATQQAQRAMAAAVASQTNLITLVGSTLDGKDRGGKSDPYFEIKSANGTLLHKSSVIKKTVAAFCFPLFSLPLLVLFLLFLLSLPDAF